MGKSLTKKETAAEAKADGLVKPEAAKVEAEAKAEPEAKPGAAKAKAKSRETTWSFTWSGLTATWMS